MQREQALSMTATFRRSSNRKKGDKRLVEQIGRLNEMRFSKVAFISPFTCCSPSFAVRKIVRKTLEFPIKAALRDLYSGARIRTGNRSARW